MNKTIKVIGVIIVCGVLGYLVGSMLAPEKENTQVDVAVETEVLTGDEELTAQPDADPAAGTILAGSQDVVPTVDADGNTLVGGDAVATPVEEGLFSATVLAGAFYYDIEEIRVKEGDTVRLTLRSVEGSHNLALDEFGIESEVVSAGEETIIEFVADKAGTYEYYCSVGSHRELGQVGTLIVE